MNDQPPPGYYPDPDDPTRRRWWDGTAWGPYPPPAIERGEEVAPAFDAERRLAGLCVRALLVGIALLIGSSVTQIVTAPNTRAQVKESIEAVQEGRQPHTIDSDSSDATAGAIGQLCTLGSLVVGVIFLMWSYRAAQVARAAGLPGAWPPLWAWLGWFIPFANFVIPYLVTRAFFPTDHPSRSTVGRWWSAYIAMYVGGALVMMVPLFVDVSTAFMIACTLAYGVLVVAAGLAARAVVIEVAHAHAALAGVPIDQSPNE